MNPTKKKSKRAQLAELDAVIEEFRRPKREGWVEATERAGNCLVALRERGFEPVIERTKPWVDFLASNSAPVVLERKPASARELDQIETDLKTALPVSYREFMTTWGSAKFMRLNQADEAAFVLKLNQSKRASQRLRKPFSKAFNDQSKAPRRQKWVPGEARTLTTEEASRALLWPVCPFYTGAFAIALGLGDDTDHAPVLCWTPDSMPEEVMPYGHTMFEWFSEMVDWTIREMTDWVGANLTS